MAIPAIVRYLNQPVHNYHEGRILFERYSDDNVLKVLFRSGEGTYHHRRLLAALDELAEKDIDTAKQMVTVEKPVVPGLETFDHAVKTLPTDDYHSFPERIKEVVRKKNMHYRRALQLYIEIGLTDDRERRLEMALTLLQDHEEVNACWAVIDEYKATGKILVERVVTIQEEVAAIPLARLGQELANIQSNISKSKKRLDSLPDGEKKAKVLLRYETYLIKRDLIRKRLEVSDE